MSDLKDVAVLVGDDGSPITPRNVAGLLHGGGSSGAAPLVGIVRVGDIDIEQGWEGVRSLLSETMISESPIRTSVGRAATISPDASKHARRNSTSSFTSLTIILGVTEW
ncbi:MAG: hypothetical protein NVS4B6_31480 [Mycobacterium sp.]